MTGQSRLDAVDDHLGDFASCRRARLPIEAADDIPVLCDVLALWRKRLPPDGLPKKHQMDPMEVGAAALPYIMLMDVHQDPLRFRYRLTGTEVDRIQNKNLTGTFVDENRPEELREILLRDLRELVESGAPHLVELSFLNSTGHSRHLRVLRLPLSASDGPASDIAHILLAFDFS